MTASIWLAALLVAVALLLSPWTATADHNGSPDVAPPGIGSVPFEPPPVDLPPFAPPRFDLPSFAPPSFAPPFFAPPSFAPSPLFDHGFSADLPSGRDVRPGFDEPPLSGDSAPFDVLRAFDGSRTLDVPPDGRLAISPLGAPGGDVPSLEGALDRPGPGPRTPDPDRPDQEPRTPDFDRPELATRTSDEVRASIERAASERELVARRSRDEARARRALLEREADLLDFTASAVLPPPAWIEVGIESDFVWALSFPADTSVTLTIRTAPGGSILFTGAGTTSSFGIELWTTFDHGVDLLPGMHVEVSAGGDSKTLVVANLSIDSVDVTTDIVSGTAPAGATVEVFAFGGGGDAGASPTADGSGAWSVNFGPLGANIVYDTRVSAWVSDVDSDVTSVLRGLPRINVSVRNNWVQATDFARNALTTLTVLNAAGTTTLFSSTITSAGDGGAFWSTFPQGLPDLLPGMRVSVTDGTATKTLVVANLNVTHIDLVSDVVTGTGTPGATVLIDASDPLGYVPDFETNVLGDGTWTADFSGSIDITPSTFFWIDEFDAERDVTSMFTGFPRVNVSLSDQYLWTSYLQADATVTLTILASPGGSTLFSDSRITDGNGYAFWGSGDLGFELLPGMQVTANDPLNSKVLVIPILSIDDVDPTGDTVSGTASPGASVVVLASGSLSVVADASGNWTADFGAAGADITANTWVQALIVDADGDQAFYTVRAPFLYASVHDDWIYGQDFALNTALTLTILDRPGGSVLYSDVLTSNGSGNAYWYSWIHGLDLVPGMELTITDGSHTKTLLLAPLSVDGIDVVADSAHGSAAAGAELSVWASDAANFTRLSLVAAGDGTWLADFGAAGHDVGYDTFVNAQVFDGDGDFTEYGVRPPRVSAWLDSDWFNVDDFTPYAEVTITIQTTPEGTVLFTGAEFVGGNGFRWWSPSDHGLDLVPGMQITATDGTTTKVLVLAELSITEANETSDVVSGTAAPGASILVDSFRDSFGAFTVTANGSGNWTFDFGAAGSDIVADNVIRAQVQDADGDWTFFDFRTPRLPSMRASLNDDWIRGSDFAANTTLTLTILNGPEGSLLYSEVRTSISSGSAFWFPGVDLLPGMELTITDGSRTKVLVLANLSVDTIDVNAETASGSAPPSTTVFVWASDPLDFTNLAVVTAGDGTWLADFGAAGHDVRFDTFVNAQLSDDDGDFTEYSTGLPDIRASLSGDWLSLDDFTPYSTLAIELLNGPGGSVLFTDTRVLGGNGFTSWSFFDLGLDLVPGMQITATDGTTTKVLVLAELSITTVDAAADTVSGTAPPGATVEVDAFGDAFGSFTTTADGGGSWTFDFGAAGSDIGSQMTIEARVTDADNDVTLVQVTGAWMHASLNDDWIHGHGFAPNAPQTLTILDGPEGWLLHSEVRTSDSSGFAFWFPGLDLLPGMELTITDGTRSKTLVLANLSVDTIDVDAETASGIAPPDSDLFVWASDPVDFTSLTIVTGGEGMWVADFGAAGHDVRYDTFVNAQVLDDDGDFTEYGTGLPDIGASLSDDWFNADDFTPYASLTVEVLSGPGGSVLFTDTRVLGGNGFTSWSFFDLGLDLVPGMQITASDGATTKVLVLPGLEITSVDFAADVISGEGLPGQAVSVSVSGSGGHRTMTVTPAGDGSWTADFGAVGFDVTFSDFIQASTVDADGDWAIFVFRTPIFTVSLTGDWISASSFTPDADLTFTILGAPDGSVLFSGVVTANELGSAFLFRSVHGVDLAPGMHVIATDGASTKEHTIIPVTIDSVDAVTDVVSGTAPAGASLFVNAFAGSNFGSIGGIVAAGDGTWVADFGAVGFDLTLGMHVQAYAVDDDGDFTQIDRPPPRINASVTGNWIEGREFTPNASVTFEVFDTPGGRLLFGPASLPTDGSGFRFVGSGELGVDLAPGNLVRVTDDVNGVVKELTLVDIVVDPVDLDADIVTGTAPPGATVRVQVGTSSSCCTTLEVAADGATGAWSADFSGTFDITTAHNVSAFVEDGDGDATFADAPQPRIHASVVADWITVLGFTPSASVAFTILAAPGGGVLFSGARTADATGRVSPFSDHGVDLLPGMEVTATDGAAAKTLVLVQLTVDPVDYDADLVTGSATPGVMVTVHVHGPTFHQLDVVADVVSGAWSANFSGIVDITPADRVDANVFDDDGDSTFDAARRPFVHASVTGDWTNAQQFSPNASVTFEIFDTAGGSLPNSASRPTDGGGFASWNFEDHGVDLAPGNVVRVTDDVSGVVKELTLVDIVVDPVDLDADIVTGTAPPGATVRVQVGTSSSCCTTLEVTADGVTGAWSADFSGTFDITTAHNVSAFVEDGDGDATFADAPRPRIDASVTRTDDPTPDGCFVDDCSLREAIIALNANPGAGTITLPAGTYLLAIAERDEDAAETGDLDITSEVTIVGADEATTIIDGGAIDRVFHVLGGADLTISGVTIQNGHAVGAGTAGGNAGVLNQGTLTMTNVTVTGNVAQNWGGGLGLGGSASATLTDVTVSDNVAQTGPGGGIVSAGSLTLANVVVSGNSATSGGGIYSINTPGGPGIVTMEGGSVAGNTASESGGGIFNDAGTVSLTSVDVVDNSAAQDGGAIFNRSAVVDGMPLTGTLMLTASTVTGNTVSGNGGGIYNSGGDVTLTNAAVSTNSAGASGGGVDNAVAVVDGTAFTGALTIDGGSVDRNSASWGGGISNEGTLTLTSVTVSANTASQTGGGIVNGAVVVSGTAFIGAVTMAGGSLDGNTATFGGGIYNYGGELTLADVAVSGNAATDADPAVSASGGGVYNTSAIIDGVVFAGTAAISGGSVTDNVAEENGGGIHNGVADLEITNTTISGNIASFGGGIKNHAGEVTLTGVAMSNNSATQEGGGIHNHSWVTDGAPLVATLTMNGGSLDGNTASRNGGGIFNGGGTLTLTAVTVSNNNATEYGGGIYTASPVVEGVLFVATLTMDGGSLGGSPADGNSVGFTGGGLYNRGGVATLTDVAVNGNTAGAAGGIFNVGITVDTTHFAGVLTMNGGSLEGNTAETVGGGLLSWIAAEATLTGVSVRSNAVTGADGWGGVGGGIYNAIGATLVVRDSTIDLNQALGGSVGRGGGLFNNAGTATLVDTVFTGNTAAGNGGGIYNNGGTLTATRVALLGNAANGRGSGLFNVEGLSLDNTPLGFAHATLEFSAIVGNADAVVNGRDAADASTLVATNNWWGCTEGPGAPGCDVLSVVGSGAAGFDPWLATLDVAASPATQAPGGSVTVFATLLDNTGAEVEGSDLTARFTRTGANPLPPPGDEQPLGSPATHTYSGTAAGEDDVTATVLFAGQEPTSPLAGVSTVTWSAAPSDSDGDGIANEVDGQFVGGSFIDESATPSIHFTDEHLGGTTSGTVVGVPAGLTVTVEEAAQPAGVLLAAAGGDGTALVSVCGADVLLTAGDSLIVTCGSLTVEVLVGPVDVMPAPGLVVNVPAGTTVTVTGLGGGEFDIVNTSGTGTVTVTTSDGATTELAPSESTTASEDATADSDGDGFSDLVESQIGTSALAACGPGAWPPDFDDSGSVNPFDVFLFRAHFGAVEGDPAYSPRFDLDASGGINPFDVFLLRQYFGTSCVAP